MTDKNVSIEPEMVMDSGYKERLKRSWPLMICLIIPGILFIGAYIYMVFQYNKLWLFNTVVHENGRYTLLEVILYFRHFLWEILIKIMFAFFTVGAFYYYGKPLIRSVKTHIPQRRIIIGSLVFVGLFIISIIVTTKNVGFKEAMAGFLQYRTHEYRPTAFGSHWRNHFLSNIVFFSAAAFMILAYRMVNQSGFSVKRKFSPLLPITVIAFILLTMVFGMTMDPFINPTYLGHQLREIFGSDLSITLFLIMAVLIYLENKYDSGVLINQGKKRQYHKEGFKNLVLWSIPIVTISGFLINKVMNLDISNQINKIGSADGWSVPDLFAWHFFEHSLDYIFVTSFVYFLYLWTLKIELKGQINAK